MTRTSLGLNGNPVTFQNAYVKSINQNLGLSINPSSASISMVEDPIYNVFFEEPTVGEYKTISAGPTWSFGGVVTKFERDIKEIGGRNITVNLLDPREIMKSIPVILAPGYNNVVEGLSDTLCSVLDVFGAFNAEDGLFNVSGWTQAGMPFNNVATALNGGSVQVGTGQVFIDRLVANAYGEKYRFDITALTDLVDPNYRVNTNLVPISNVIEDLSNKYLFDWYIESERAADGIIDVTIKIIDRSTDSTSIGLQEFMDLHDHVISATSGVELRNEIACTVLLGAPVEQFQKVDILGLANEPIDLVPESGSNQYVMTEKEMRVILAGKMAWELWLEIPNNLGGGGGLTRYGGSLQNEYMQPLIKATEILKLFGDNQNIPRNELRNKLYLLSDQYALVGKIYEKLKGHAEASYGKRWVHDQILDEIIDSAWTRDVVAGDNDPYEYFRQDDGRTRAFVEYTTNPQGGSFSFSTANLNNLFGNLDIFRYITRFGRTFENVLDVSSIPGSILSLELNGAFNPSSMNTDLDKSMYTYNDSVNSQITSIKTSLYVSATVDKDGVIAIDSPIYESEPNLDELLDEFFENASVQTNNIATSTDIGQLEAQLALVDENLDALFEAKANGQDVDLAIENANKTRSSIELRLLELRQQQDNNEDEESPGETFTDADGNTTSILDQILFNIKKIFGPNLLDMTTRSYQPSFAHIPVRAKYARYGPIFSSNIGPNSEGRLDIIQDDGYAPWEFGSVSTMTEAMQLKVNNASSNIKEVFTGTVEAENYPKFKVGEAIERNANINSISMTFGNGVRTTYGLQTYTRKFGEFSKEDWARIALFSNNSANRIFAQRTISFNEQHRYKVNKQIANRSGRIPRSASKGGAKSFD